MAKADRLQDPRKNEFIEDDVADLLFDDDEDELILAPQFKAVLLEYTGGQPPVTQEQCNTFLAGVASGMSQAKAAAAAEAAWTTFYRLRQSNEVFKLAFEEAIAMRKEYLRETSIEQALDGVRTGKGLTFPANPQLQMHIKAAFPDEYRERSEVIERKGEDVRPIGREGDREKLISMIEKYGVKEDEDDVTDLL